MGSLPKAGALEAPIAERVRVWGWLWGTARRTATPDDDVRRYCYRTFKVESMTALSTDQLKSVIEWLLDEGE